MSYEIKDRAKLARKWKTIFGDLPLHIDAVTSRACRCLILDIVKYEIELIKKYPHYDWDNTSMEEVTCEQYGEEGVKLVKNLF